MIQGGYRRDDPVARLGESGARRGELQALRVCDIDFETNVVAVERGWDQEEGVIEPKSLAGRRTVPLLAILRDYLEVSLEATGRSGEDLLFGRTTEEAFYASTIDHRAKRAWKVANERVADLRRQIDYLASTVALLPASPRRAAARSAVEAIDRDVAELLRHLGVDVPPSRPRNR